MHTGILSFSYVATLDGVHLVTESGDTGHKRKLLFLGLALQAQLTPAQRQVGSQVRRKA